MRVMGKIWWLGDPLDYATWETLAVNEPEAEEDDSVFHVFDTPDELFSNIERQLPGRPWVIQDIDDWNFHER